MPRDLHTARLKLRRWRESDREPFAALNADRQVMEYFAARLSRRESDRMIEAIEAEFDRCGFGLWALEVQASGEFVGFTGLAEVSFTAPFTPAVEVGWRLARSAWGMGFATEAARAAIAFGFAEAGLEQVVAITSVSNRRSEAVMVRLGMTRDPGEDFDHPSIAPGHPLRPHLLYRLAAEDWGSR
jgi:RimJ/RimL family protein N-acetyltransferase